MFPVAASSGGRVQPTPASTAPQIEAVSAKSLVVALDHFVDALRNRSIIHNGDSDGELANAAQELQRETVVYAAAPRNFRRSRKASAAFRGPPGFGR